MDLQRLDGVRRAGGVEPAPRPEQRGDERPGRRGSAARAARRALRRMARAPAITPPPRGPARAPQRGGELVVRRPGARRQRTHDDPAARREPVELADRQVPQPAADPVADHGLAHGPRHDEADPRRDRRRRPQGRATWTTSSPAARVPRAERRVATKSARRRSREPAGSTGQADRRVRPLERRAARIDRPARVRIRRRKPWVLARRRLFGWKVRLLTRGLLDLRRMGGLLGGWTRRRCEHRSSRRQRDRPRYGRPPPPVKLVTRVQRDPPRTHKKCRTGCGQPLAARHRTLLASRGSPAPSPRVRRPSALAVPAGGFRRPSAGRRPDPPFPGSAPFPTRGAVPVGHDDRDER